ncbi:MAG: response regulator [Planctomycetes bacterium]|nr:response regulator [Planctomycetota bacterium]
MEKLRILVAEDDEGLRNMLAEVLPYDVAFVRDGQECLDMLDQQTFDVLLLDIMLPKVSGLDLLRRTKANRPEVPVVVMTGFADSLRQQVMAMGVDVFLEKPFLPEDILSAIQQALGRRGKAKPEA